MPALARAASKVSVNCPARSRTRNRKSSARVAEVHQEVADLLGGPRPVRVSGDSEDVDVSRAGFDDEEAVQAPECRRAVHVEEVGGEDGRGLDVQELPPGRVGVPLRRWRDLQGSEDPADG
jgi:hypothetical protein